MTPERVINVAFRLYHIDPSAPGSSVPIFYER